MAGERSPLRRIGLWGSPRWPRNAARVGFRAGFRFLSLGWSLALLCGALLGSRGAMAASESGAQAPSS